jgi:hypothetical protein
VDSPDGPQARPAFFRPTQRRVHQAMLSDSMHGSLNARKVFVTNCIAVSLAVRVPSFCFGKKLIIIVDDIRNDFNVTTHDFRCEA